MARPLAIPAPKRRPRARERTPPTVRFDSKNQISSPFSSPLFLLLPIPASPLSLSRSLARSLSLSLCLSLSLSLPLSEPLSFFLFATLSLSLFHALPPLSLPLSLSLALSTNTPSEHDSLLSHEDAPVVARPLHVFFTRSICPSCTFLCAFPAPNAFGPSACIFYTGRIVPPLNVTELVRACCPRDCKVLSRPRGR